MAAALGCLLGFCNVVFIAIGLEWRDPKLQAMWVITFGIVPGIVTGAVAGALAGATSACPVWPRRVLLANPALAVVATLACEFGVDEHFLVAAIPTLVAVMLLERYTRIVEPLPAATPQR